MNVQNLPMKLTKANNVPTKARGLQSSGPRARFTLLITIITLTLTFASTTHAQPNPDAPSTIIGIHALKQRLGPIDMPTGFGVVVGHVEGGKPKAYAPHVRDPLFDGVKFTYRSGISEISGHAQATAKVIYGPKGLAPGIRQVNCYFAGTWLKEGCLFTGTNQPPKADGSDILNHSWIAGDDSPFTSKALRRLDYLIDTTDTLAIIGVNNGKQNPVPPLLASSYNGIAVGRDNGQSSGGRTLVEGKGRGKPDLVAPGALTSFCTPVVTAAAAYMVQIAKAHPQAQWARKPQVIKAALMAGARKSEHWKHYPDHPLDVHLGAGVVNVDHSYDILIQPATPPGMIQKDTGWSYFQITPRQMHSWYWDVKQPLTDATLALVWHRRIDGRQLSDGITRKTIWIDTPYLADLDIKLVSLEKGHVASSHSKVDNVELIHVPQLEAGQYEIQVGRKDSLNTTWDAALAWWGKPE
ncbi:MAG: hypothetical protein CMJ19_21990 [Phycisphaeraceae bacterium]|nr:hypothetical protein [Phycisphaeraceae bacterium]